MARLRSSTWLTRYISFCTLLFVTGVFHLPVMGQGAKVTVPPGVSGYKVIVESDWVTTRQGFRPITVNIETYPKKATVIDETFTVSAIFRQRRAVPYVVKSTVVIPAGNTSATAVIYPSSIKSTNAYIGRLLVEQGEYDGRFNRQDLLETNISQMNYYLDPPGTLLIRSDSSTRKQSFICFDGRMSDPQPGMVSIGESKTKVPSLDKFLPIYLHQNQFQAGTTPVTAIANYGSISAVHPSQLPGNWIGLTSVDRIIISMEELKNLCETNELQRANLEKWVAAGGCLIVNSVGDLKEADDVWPALLGSARAIPIEKGISPWNSPAPEIKKLKKVMMADEQYQYYYRRNERWLEQAEQQDFLDKNYAKLRKSMFDKSADLALAKYVSGQIVVVPTDMSGWAEQDWMLMHNMMQLNGRSLRMRLGPNTGETELSGFRIPGVGEPPVRMFQLLVSGFLILVGPVMLVLLRRTKKMQLIFVLVPLTSVLVCLSLFTYAVLVDGTAKWGRTQTVTMMDHRTNTAVTQARSVYYSGSSPREYQYSDEVLAYSPVTRATNVLEADYRQGRIGLRGGKIRPRTPHEVLTVQVKTSNERLLIRNSGSGKNELTVENRLSGKVVAAVIRVEDKYYLLREPLDVGQVRAAGLGDDLAAELLLQKEVLPRSPERIQTGGLIQNFPVYSQTQLGDEHAFISQLRNEDLTMLLNETNTYVAIVEDFELVQDQIEDVNYKLQLHVVRGKW